MNDDEIQGTGGVLMAQVLASRLVLTVHLLFLNSFCFGEREGFLEFEDILFFIFLFPLFFFLLSKI